MWWVFFLYMLLAFYQKYWSNGRHVSKLPNDKVKEFSTFETNKVKQNIADPCMGVTCPDPEVCQLDDRRQPSCRCAEPCPLEFSPVCASDGKTYSNECQMHRESCRARKQLKIVFKGQCSTGEVRAYLNTLSKWHLLLLLGKNVLDEKAMVPLHIVLSVAKK